MHFNWFTLWQILLKDLDLQDSVRSVNGPKIIFSIIVFFELILGSNDTLIDIIAELGVEKT